MSPPCPEAPLVESLKGSLEGRASRFLLCWSSAGSRRIMVLVGIQQPALSGLCFGRGEGICTLLAHILWIHFSGPSLKFLRLMRLMPGAEGKKCNFLPILAFEYLCLPVWSNHHNYHTPLMAWDSVPPFRGLLCPQLAG